MLDLDSLSDDRARLMAPHCRRFGLPAVAVLSLEHTADYDPSPDVDDLILQTFRVAELVLRLNKVNSNVRGSPGNWTVKIGDLLIDTDRYEVRLAGRRVSLTY